MNNSITFCTNIKKTKKMWNERNKISRKMIFCDLSDQIHRGKIPTPAPE